MIPSFAIIPSFIPFVQLEWMNGNVCKSIKHHVPADAKWCLLIVENNDDSTELIGIRAEITEEWSAKNLVENYF